MTNAFDVGITMRRAKIDLAAADFFPIERIFPKPLLAGKRASKVRRRYSTK